MTADELARVTAERDAAVAALAKVEALHVRASNWMGDYCQICAPRDDVGVYDPVWPCATLSALAGAEGDAGGEVAPAGSVGPNGVQKRRWGVCDNDGEVSEQQSETAARFMCNTRRAAGQGVWVVYMDPRMPDIWQAAAPPPVPMPTWDRNGPTGEAME